MDRFDRGIFALLRGRGVGDFRNRAKLRVTRLNAHGVSVLESVVPQLGIQALRIPDCQLQISRRQWERSEIQAQLIASGRLSIEMYDNHRRCPDSPGTYATKPTDQADENDANGDESAAQFADPTGNIFVTKRAKPGKSRIKPGNASSPKRGDLNNFRDIPNTTPRRRARIRGDS